MHQAQASSTTSVSASEANCGLDVKPSLSNGGNNGGQSVPKQREGTSSLNVNSNNNGSGQSASNAAASQGANGGAGLNGGLFDVPQNPYNGYENGGGYGGSGGGGGSGAGYGAHPSQGNAYQSSTGAKMAMNSPHSNSQRTKSRTNAGKTFIRHGVGYLVMI